MEQIIEKITGILYNKKAFDIVALDVRDLTSITEYMIIANGRSTLQVRNLAEEVEDQLSAEGILPLRKDGQGDSHWVVLDYGHVLVHVFHYEDREYFHLDKLWQKDGNTIPLSFDEEK